MTAPAAAPLLRKPGPDDTIDAIRADYREAADLAHARLISPDDARRIRAALEARLAAVTKKGNAR